MTRTAGGETGKPAQGGETGKPAQGGVSKLVRGGAGQAVPAGAAEEDFGPSEKTPRSAHWTYGLCAAACVLFGFWASVSELDIVSTSMGEVIPSTSIKTVQHLEGGIVKELLAREGAKVKAGEPLLVLAPTQSSADVGELKERIIGLEIEIARLEALREGSARPVFPETIQADYPRLIDQAVNRFRATLDTHNSEVARQAAAVTQRRQEINEIETRIKNSRASLNLVAEQVKISEGLLERDLTNRFLHLDLLKEQGQLEGQVSQDEASLERARAGVREEEAALDSIRKLFVEENETALEEARLNLRELTQRISKFRDSLDRTVVRSPVDGTVKTLHVVTIGGVIRPGEPVADIVPAGDKLIIEAQLATQDIGYVQPGQRARVKLASADAVRFGALDGEVIGISPDTIEDDQGMPFYKVRIATEADHFARGDLRYNLFPGMQVIADVQTGSRTVLRYIVDPLVANMDDAFRER